MIHLSVRPSATLTDGWSVRTEEVRPLKRGLRRLLLVALALLAGCGRSYLCPTTDAEAQRTYQGCCYQINLATAGRPSSVALIMDRQYLLDQCMVLAGCQRAP